jgi:hypothetical protein
MVLAYVNIFAKAWMASWDSWLIISEPLGMARHPKKPSKKPHRSGRLLQVSKRKKEKN